MTLFRRPVRPFWLSAPDENEIDYYLKDLIVNFDQCVENLTPTDCEKYTSFLNKENILYMWNTITSTTIPLPSIVFDTAVNATRMINGGRRTTIQEIYREDYCFNVLYPYSPLVFDALGRYHPIEVCAFRIVKNQ